MDMLSHVTEKPGMAFAKAVIGKKKRNFQKYTKGLSMAKEAELRS